MNDEHEMLMKLHKKNKWKLDVMILSILIGVMLWSLMQFKIL